MEQLEGRLARRHRRAARGRGRRHPRQRQWPAGRRAGRARPGRRAAADGLSDRPRCGPAPVRRHRRAEGAAAGRVPAGGARRRRRSHLPACNTGRVRGSLPLHASMRTEETAPRLARLAHVIVRRRRAVIAAWVVLTLFGAFSAGQVADRWFESFSSPGYSSYEANQRTLKTFGTGENAPLVAVFHSDGDVTREKGIATAVAAGAAVNPGSRTSSYFSTGSRAYVSKDGHTTFAEIYPPGTPTFSSSVHIDEVRAKIKAAAPEGVQANLTGRDPLYEASSGGESGGPSVLTEALIGGLGCLVILFFVFGTVPAVLLPLAIAVASILNTFTLVWALTYVTNVSIIVP